MLRPALCLASLLAVAGCSEYELSGPEGTTPPGDEATGALAGRICAPDAVHWVVGAEIDVIAGEQVIEGTTDADGAFHIEGIPAGDWQVVVEKGSFSLTEQVTIVADEVTELPEDTCIEQGDIEIAVVTGQFDRIEEILGHLSFEYDIVDGLGMDYTTGMSTAEAFLTDPAEMQQYDIIFFNCGMDDTWTWTSEGAVAQNLRDFVAAGGSVYASDWAYYIVEAAWPDMNTFHGDDAYPGEAYVGETGSYTADVLDPVMAQRLGSSTAHLNYDLDLWVAVEATHQGDILIEGEYDLYSFETGPATQRGPLASRMEHGDGTVLYTTFHNETQTTLDMDLLLQEIILSL